MRVSGDSKFTLQSLTTSKMRKKRDQYQKIAGGNFLVTIKDVFRSCNVLPLSCTHLHALCFISNVYKQRFLGLVKFLKKISNRTSLF